MVEYILEPPMGDLVKKKRLGFQQPQNAAGRGSSKSGEHCWRI